MSLQAESPALAVSSVAPRRRARLLRSAIAAFVLLLIQYGLGMYVNLYVTIPRADHGTGMSRVIANGPAMLSVHAAIGLLLTVVALGTLAQAIMLRQAWAIAASAVALLAMAFASVAGSSFAASGQASESMAMAVMTGAGLLCYAVIIYLLLRAVKPARPPGHSPAGHPARR